MRTMGRNNPVLTLSMVSHRLPSPKYQPRVCVITKPWEHGSRAVHNCIENMRHLGDIPKSFANYNKTVT